MNGDTTRRPALLVLDLINDIVHQDGTYAEVCLEQVTQRGVIERTARAIARARAAGIPVVYVVVGFSPGYPDWPADSPVFAESRHKNGLILGTWGTRVHDALAPAPGEPVVEKRRVDPFHGTQLDLLLRNLNVNTLLLTGVVTELVILGTARAGHDRDYRIEVLEDATATANQELHEAAIAIAARTATITTVDQALPELIHS
jgi:nicotinamidase-related amidase